MDPSVRYLSIEQEAVGRESVSVTSSRLLQDTETETYKTEDRDRDTDTVWEHATDNLPRDLRTASLGAPHAKQQEQKAARTLVMAALGYQS